MMPIKFLKMGLGLSEKFTLGALLSGNRKYTPVRIMSATAISTTKT
jgi:hypothetical protein